MYIPPTITILLAGKTVAYLQSNVPYSYILEKQGVATRFCWLSCFYICSNCPFRERLACLVTSATCSYSSEYCYNACAVILCYCTMQCTQRRSAHFELYNYCHSLIWLGEFIWAPSFNVKTIRLATIMLL